MITRLKPDFVLFPEIIIYSSAQYYLLHTENELLTPYIEHI
ncbi:MAG: hypothetical protein JWR67_3621 [Mucilaginibacter sp.]|nr:hypothetical protein [Mucilaginibacter sp.]